MKVGIDIGGTFTDLVAATSDGISVVKVASTPDDPARGFGVALDRVDGEVGEILHGTTVATNAVLTRSGARLAFVATDGFQHLLQLARQDRQGLYDLHPGRPEPLVPLERCFGVRERVGPDGSVLADLNADRLRSALRDLEVDGVAVTLLHSYANPDHERRVADLIREALPGASVSISSEVLAEFREYERASTTVLNAYVQPVLSRYLDRVRQATGRARLGVMWSGGGVRSMEASIDLPVQTLMSGPAAGVLAAAWIGRRCGFDDLVTLDMGGTSADVAIVDEGRPLVAESSTLDGLPFRTPCLEVISVGAGGGSIAWVDEGGALRVGPGSAGADPGPACYGLGGTEATVTDAQVVLGYLGAEGLAGGELALHAAAAHRTTSELGERCGLDAEQTASGVLRVVRATMARTVRSVSIERGRDVRDHTLVAFGGAGPLHATALAAELGIRRVIVPPAPGTLAALGLLVASRRSDASVSRPMTADRSQDDVLRSVLDDLTRQVLAEIASEGVASPNAQLVCEVDLRYEGQSHELRIAVRGGPSFALLIEAFHRAHAERYGFAESSRRVEAVTFRASATGPPGDLEPGSPAADRPPTPVDARNVGSVEAPVFRRADLPTHHRFKGPAVITELDSTTWIDEQATAEVHPTGALIVEV